MTNAVLDAFQKVSALTLEDWAMMLIDDETPEKSEFEDEKLFLGSTSYTGIVNAKVGILCTEAFCQGLYMSVLGEIEEGINEEGLKDALSEMVNVFIGNFLTEAYGPDTVFAIGTPSSKIVGEEEMKEFFSNKFFFSFTADDEPVAIALMRD